MLRKIFILFILIVSSRTCIAQQVDTSLVLKYLKIRLFSELDLSLQNENALNDYFKRQLKATVLKSKGFENFIFFKISDQVLAIDSLPERREIISYSLPLCLKIDGDCCFVYAFNKVNNNFYRLKGTNKNDIDDFYKSLQLDWIDWKPIKKINQSLINKFTEEYWVEGLDFECLLNSLKGKQGNCLDYYSPKLIVY